MVSNDSAAASQPSSSSSSGAKADADRKSAECARGPIEVGPENTGTTNDPGATDRKPVGAAELDLFLG